MNTLDKLLGIEPVATPQEPRLPKCKNKCGRLVQYAGRLICEPCAVEAAARYSGKSQRVRVEKAHLFADDEDDGLSPLLSEPPRPRREPDMIPGRTFGRR